jgi:hypothetical protein
MAQGMVRVDPLWLPPEVTNKNGGQHKWGNQKIVLAIEIRWCVVTVFSIY